MKGQGTKRGVAPQELARFIAFFGRAGAAHPPLLTQMESALCAPMARNFADVPLLTVLSRKARGDWVPGWEPACGVVELGLIS